MTLIFVFAVYCRIIFFRGFMNIYLLIVVKLFCSRYSDEGVFMIGHDNLKFHQSISEDKIKIQKHIFYLETKLMSNSSSLKII